MPIFFVSIKPNTDKIINYIIKSISCAQFINDCAKCHSNNETDIVNYVIAPLSKENYKFYCFKD